jgi:hypothetical protein
MRMRSPSAQQQQRACQSQKPWFFNSIWVGAGSAGRSSLRSNQAPHTRGRSFLRRRATSHAIQTHMLEQPRTYDALAISAVLAAAAHCNAGRQGWVRSVSICNLRRVRFVPIGRHRHNRIPPASALVRSSRISCYGRNRPAAEYGLSGYGNGTTMSVRLSKADISGSICDI